MQKKIIKLINNERINRRIISAKGCESTSVDECSVFNTDNAHCTLYATDICTKEDYAACSEGGYDICNQDYSAGGCIGADGRDYCTTDIE